MGIIDLVTEEGDIIDHKTAGKDFRKKWNQGAVDNNPQLTFYAAAYRKTFLTQERSVQIHVLPRMFAPPFPVIQSYRNQDQIVQILSNASAMEEIINAGIFLAYTHNCKTCPFNKVCPKVSIYPDSNS